MAVITSDSDLVTICHIRLIGSYGSCMQLNCRNRTLFHVRSESPTGFF